jgi:hypothetical protein
MAASNHPSIEYRVNTIDLHPGDDHRDYRAKMSGAKAACVHAYRYDTWRTECHVYSMFGNVQSLLHTVLMQKCRTFLGGIISSNLFQVSLPHV